MDVEFKFIMKQKKFLLLIIMGHAVLLAKRVFVQT